MQGVFFGVNEFKENLDYIVNLILDQEESINDSRVEVELDYLPKLGIIDLYLKVNDKTKDSYSNAKPLEITHSFWDTTLN
jgi:hypothetical protein